MKLSDKMTMLDAIKLIKEIAGDDTAMRDDIRTSLYNMADTDDDLSDESIDAWVKAYPEDKHEKLRSLFTGPAVEVVKTKIEGGKDQPPADIQDSPAGEQLAENEELSDEELQAAINDVLGKLGADEGDEPADTPPADDLPDDTPAEEPKSEESDKSADEPADKEQDEPDTGSEEQDETTRNILAGLSNK